MDALRPTHLLGKFGFRLIIDRGRAIMGIVNNVKLIDSEPEAQPRPRALSGKRGSEAWPRPARRGPAEAYVLCANRASIAHLAERLFRKQLSEVQVLVEAPCRGNSMVRDA